MPARIAALLAGPFDPRLPQARSSPASALPEPGSPEPHSPGLAAPVVAAPAPAREPRIRVSPERSSPNPYTTAADSPSSIPATARCAVSTQSALHLPDDRSE